MTPSEIEELKNNNNIFKAKRKLKYVVEDSDDTERYQCMYVCMHVCYATLTCMHTYMQIGKMVFGSVLKKVETSPYIPCPIVRVLYSYGKYVYSYMHVHFSGTVSPGFWQRQENIRSKGIHYTRGHCWDANKGERLVNYYLLILLLLLALHALII